MFDENFDVEKIDTLSGCGKCVFCLAKCPKCQTADISIQYHREYKENGDVDSMALVACKCSRTLIEEFTLPGSAFTDGKPQTQPVYSQKLYEVPELTEIIDKFFENCKPKEPADVHLFYELDNDTKDALTLRLEDIDNYVEFEDERPSEIRFEFNNHDRKIEESEFICELVEKNVN